MRTRRSGSAGSAMSNARHTRWKQHAPKVWRCVTRPNTPPLHHVMYYCGNFPGFSFRRRLRLFYSPTDLTCTCKACQSANTTGRSRRTIPTTTRRARLIATVSRSPGRTVTLTSVVYVFAIGKHLPRSCQEACRNMSLLSSLSRCALASVSISEYPY